MWYYFKMWKASKKKPEQSESQGCVPQVLAGHMASVWWEVQCWAMSHPEMPDRRENQEKQASKNLEL